MAMVNIISIGLMLNAERMVEKSITKIHLIRFQSYLYMGPAMLAMAEEESMAMKYGKQVLDH